MMEPLLGFPCYYREHARQIIHSSARTGKTKQVRKPSYTHEEITVLPEEVAANKVIIQSTLNSEVTNQQNGQLWQDIARKGSNCGVCVRTPDQVREKLSDMKKDFFTEREKKKQQQETNKKMGNWSHPGQTV